MNPVDHPEVFETVTVAGVTWDGTVTIAGLKYVMGWTFTDADGESGSTATRKGRKASHFTLRFDLVVDPSRGIDQFSEWYGTWVPLLLSCFEGEEPIGLALEHPDAQALKVDSILVKEIGQVQRDPDDYGHGVVDVAVTQYAPAKEVSTKSPGRSKSKGGGGTGAGGADDYDPNDPINKKREALEEALAGP